MAQLFDLSTTIKLKFFTGFIDIYCTISFEVTDWGYAGSWDEPPCGPEFDITEIFISAIYDTINYNNFDSQSQNNIEAAVEEHVCSLQFDGGPFDDNECI